MEPIVIAATGALLARAGLSLYTLGLCRAKNAAGAALRAAVDLCFVVLAFWCVGGAVLGQEQNPVFGVAPRLLFGGGGGGASNAPLVSGAAGMLLATGLAIGVLAERATLLSACGMSALLGALVLPAAGRWAWGGWLHRLGFLDVGGAAAFHVAAGVCAAVGAVFAGPRTGKYNRDGSASMIPGHTVPLAGAGVLAVLAGWLAYAAGMAPAGGGPAAAADALLAAAAAGAAALVVGEVRYHKADIGMVFLAMLGGLVAVSAAAGVVNTFGAVVIGGGAGVLVPTAAVWIDLRLRVDDPVGAIAVQVVGGAWGTLASPLLLPASLGLRLKNLGVQAAGLVAIAALSAGLAALFFGVLRRAGRLRASEADEYDGLDLAEHDVAAYPDFQQNMIKSYHLREA